MDIRDHSSKFTVYVFAPQIENGAEVKVTLSRAGYDAYYFEDVGTLEHRLAETAPHILVFTTEGLEGNLNDFVEKVRGFNEDIKFVIVSKVEQFNVLAEYNAFGVEEILENNPVALPGRVQWAVDRTCEKIYLTYQNEQLFDQWKDAQERALKAEKAIPLTPPVTESFSTKITEYKSAESKEELIQKLMNLLPASAVYFKFLPTVGSFVATHSHGFDPNQIQGVGAYLTKEEIKDLNGKIILGQAPASFAKLLQDAFQFHPEKILPLYVHNHLEGVLAYNSPADVNVAAHFTEEFNLFSLCYSHFSLEKKVDNLEVQDFITEVYNRNFYLKSLHGELDRARRQRQPLSVIKLAIDDFYEIEQSLGEAMRDALLKSLADVVLKSSRTNDLTCRTQMNEFSLILPHCSRKGAAMRAERLRRIVESSSLMESGLKVSISLGISEFPSMCNSSETLDETASKALAHIIDKGGNKICLYKAPSNYTPEFEVPAE